MIHDDFSYWLEVSGKDTPAACAMLDADGTLVGEMTGPESAEYEVPDKLGTIEEWTDVDDVMLRISKACPDAALSLMSINEVDKSERRSVYRNGAMTEKRSRMIGADDDYDIPTVKAVIEYLAGCGYTSTAQRVKDEFLAG